jgi:Rrf2 family transcriptional regulator, nitric oxide-sensitive transcriptional repressor
MRLTTYTDYALRTLMYLAVNRDQLVTIRDIADVHGIAKNHLTKVVHQLGILGFVETVRGRNGGLRLGKEPALINIGAVVRSTEPDFFMAECFDKSRNECILTPSCGLKGVLRDATAAFLEVLDGATLENLVKKNNARSATAGTLKPVRLHATLKTATKTPAKAT